MMRDDFTLFDAYEHTPMGTKLSVPIAAYYARDDQNVKKHHVEGWAGLTSAAFSISEVEGNHLFFYQYDVRNAWMQRVIDGLPLM